MQDKAARICAIHQPNFFPWCGYFDKLRQADVFVFLDQVDYPRSGSGGMGSYVNRVTVNIQGQAKWLGAPVENYSGTKNICDVRISQDAGWRKKAVKTLQAAYGKARNFSQGMDLLLPLVENTDDRLSHYNMNAITSISKALGIDCELRVQSEIGTSETATNRLIELCKKTGAATYLSGGGAGGYQEDDLFAAAGIALRSQDFEPVNYMGDQTFLPGLSIIDYLMHVKDWTKFPEGDALA